MSSLLSVKTSSTLGEVFVTDGGVESALMLQEGKDTRSHNKEDGLEVEMAETKVPTKKFLLRCSQIDVGVTDNRKSHRKGFDCLVGIFRAMDWTSQKVVGQIDTNRHRGPSRIRLDAAETEFMRLNQDSLIRISL